MRRIYLQISREIFLPHKINRPSAVWELEGDIPLQAFDKSEHVLEIRQYFSIHVFRNCLLHNVNLRMTCIHPIIFRCKWCVKLRLPNSYFNWDPRVKVLEMGKCFFFNFFLFKLIVHANIHSRTLQITF